MTRFWTETVNRLTPYVPGEQRAGDDIIKLNTNENPYPPSPRVIQAIHALGGDQLRRYPDPESVALRQSLASYHGIALENVFVGNGSDEILALAFLAFFTNGRALQYPDITYSFYPVYCDLYGIQSSTVSLDDDYTLPLERFRANEGSIIFPNPNAPTAIATPQDQIADLLTRHTEQLMLVDEAYADFGAQSAIPLIHDYPNLLISHTFSKGRSLAGMRLGAAFGDPSLIEGLQRIKNSFNSYPVDALAQAAGVASLDDESYYRDTVSAIVQTRQWTVKQLQQRGFEVLPSAANFVFARAPHNSAAQLFQKLSKAGVLVRYWNSPRLDAWLRISIGTDEDMQKLMKCIDA